MANIRTNTYNAFEIELAQEFGATDLTIVTPSMGALRPPVPCYLVLDPLSESAGREYILFDAGSTDTSYTTSSISNRYLVGSSAAGGLIHPAGTLVRMSPLMQHIDDLNDRIDQRLLASLHTRAMHEAMAIDHGSLGNLTSGDPHNQYLTSARHNALAHDDRLAVTPNGLRLSVQGSAPSSPSFGDLWVNPSA